MVSDNLKEKIVFLREKYKPKEIKFLLIAIAPPESLDTFFYNVKVNKYVALYLETMKVVYPENYLKTRSDLLKEFQKDGFYLEDVCDEPIGSTS